MEIDHGITALQHLIDLRQMVSLPFGALVEYHPISQKGQARNHEFGKILLPEIFSWPRVSLGVNLERRHSDCG